MLNTNLFQFRDQFLDICTRCRYAHLKPSYFFSFLFVLVCFFLLYSLVRLVSFTKTCAKVRVLLAKQLIGHTFGVLLTIARRRRRRRKRRRGRRKNKKREREKKREHVFNQCIRKQSRGVSRRLLFMLSVVPESVMNTKYPFAPELSKNPKED